MKVNSVEWKEKLENEQNAKIAELKSKFDNREITSSVYKKEIRKCEGIKNNISKVVNILVLLEKYENTRNGLKQQIEKVITLQKYERNQNVKEQRLEKELNEIQKDIIDVQKRLKDSEISKYDKMALTQQLEDLYKKKNKNQDEFVRSCSDMDEKKKELGLDEKLGTSLQDLKIKDSEMKTKIDKCNIVVESLMLGVSWNFVEVKLKEYDEQENNKVNIDSLEEKITKETENSEEKLTAEQDNKEEIGQEEKEYAKIEQEALNNGENLPIAKTRFPRLAKIANFIKDKWNKIFNRKNEKIEENEQKLVEIPKETEKVETKKEETVQKVEDFKESLKIPQEKEESTEKEVSTENDYFNEFLREVAEKGLDGIAKEKEEAIKEAEARKEAEAKKEILEKIRIENQKEKEAKRIAEEKKAVAKAKFAEMKLEAYDRESEKFGKEYAGRSYKEEQGEERDWRADESKSNRIQNINVKNQGTQIVNAEYMCSMQEDLTKAIEETIKEQHDKRKKEEMEIGE